MGRFLLGLDTETFEGYARLVCIENKPYWISPDFTKPNPEIIDYLIKNPGAHCAWNMNFDASAILKHTSEETVKRLLLFSEASFETPSGKQVKITYFKGKFLSIKHHRNRAAFTLFDSAQFYHSSLNDAAKKVLGEAKIEDKEFAAELNTSLSPWVEHRDRIIAYCQDDANKAGLLMRLFLEAMEKLGIKVDRPYSSAYVAQCMILQNIRDWLEVKTYNNRGMERKLSYRRHSAYDEHGTLAYMGARFEILKKGRFPNAAVLDIKSAYPYAMTKLFHPADIYYSQSVIDSLPESAAPSTIIEAYVEVPKNLPIGPLPFRLKDCLIWPTGIWKSWFHFCELQEAAKWGCRIEPIRMLEAIPKPNARKPLEPLILGLYNQRQKWLKDNDMRELAAKIAMNGGYGKLQQLNPVVFENPDGGFEIDGVIYSKAKEEPGRIYSPLYGGFITAHTRTQLLSTARQFIPLDSIIGFATDSILTTQIPSSLPLGNNLGDWNLEAEGPGLIIRNGVYQIADKTRTRGIKRGGNSNDSDKRPIEQRLSVIDGTIHFEGIHRGPIQLSQSLRLKKYSLKDALVWYEEPRLMNVEQDEKRLWPTYGLETLLSEAIHSRPVDIGTVISP